MSEKPNYRLQVECDCCGAAAGEFCKGQGLDPDCECCKAQLDALARGEMYCAGGLRQLVDMFEGDRAKAEEFRENDRKQSKRRRRLDA
jgi:hypothetical protein